DGRQRTCLGYLIRGATQADRWLHVVAAEDLQEGVNHAYHGCSKYRRVCIKSNRSVAGALTERIRAGRRVALCRPDPLSRHVADTGGHLHHVDCKRLGTGGALARSRNGFYAGKLSTGRPWQSNRTTCHVLQRHCDAELRPLSAVL